MTIQQATDKLIDLIPVAVTLDLVDKASKRVLEDRDEPKIEYPKLM